MARGNNEAHNPNRRVDPWSTPAMKAQLAYEARRDTALGAPAADIAESVSEKDEPVRDRGDAIISDLQAMLEGRMAPKRSITQLGKGKQ